MKLEKLKNPKVWAPTLLVLASLSTIPFWVGEDREDKHGREPHEVAVMWENAYLQDNGALIRELSVPEYAKEIAEVLDISLTQGKQNDEKIPDNWVIEEYRISEDHYLCHLMWVDETVGKSGNYFRIKRINDEWRVDDLDPREFDLEITGLEPRIIRGNEQ